MSDMRRSCNLTGLRSPSYCWSVADTPAMRSLTRWRKPTCAPLGYTPDREL